MERVIVITGASRGIGKELALRLAAQGEYLMLGARSQPELGQVARACGRDTFAYTTDVSRRQEVQRLFDEAIRTFDHIDVWINNAGVGISRPVLELTDEDVDQMMSLNLKSALYGMQIAGKYFAERGSGHIINVSSVLSRLPMSSPRSAYSAAKAALNSLTANLRMDLHPIAPDVKVSLILPGPVDTGFAGSAVHADSATLPPPNAQPVGEVVDVILKCIDEPVAEIYTDAAQRQRMLTYFNDVAAFERQLN